MTQQKVLNLIGLAYRARKCAHGVNLIMEQIQNNRAHFVIIAQDAKENSRKKLINKCKSHNVPYKELADRKLLGNAIGKEARIAIAILDQGFARKIHSLLQN